MERYDFVTLVDNEEMFWFNEKEGLWKPKGELLIKEIGTNLLGSETKQVYLSETIGYIKARTYKERSVFDNPNLNLLPVKNGILNLETLELISYSREHYFTSKLNVDYNPQDDCPKIKKFLIEIVAPEDVDLLIEIGGYCLYRKYHIQKAMMLVGDGANGKSTYLLLICYFLGEDNVCSVSLQDLEQNRFASSNLYRKLANIYADLPKMALKNPGKFKMLVGGDKIHGEKKFKDSFFFYNYSKLIFSANQVPFVEDDSNAFFRRWIIINFPFKFEGEKADTKILEKLTTPEEMSGFLNLILAGLKRVLDKGFSYKKTTEEIREDYIRSSDPIGAFILDCVIQSSEDFIEKDKLYNSYVNYCKVKKFPVVDKNVFSKNFRRYVQVEDYKPTIDGDRVQCFRGIKVVKPVNGVNGASNLSSIGDGEETKIGNKVDTIDNLDGNLNDYNENKEMVK
jgi:putative DNA primase/helicase